LRFVLATFAAVALVTAARAQDSAAEGSVLSPGRQFAEQGGAAIYANVCAACHQPDGKGAKGAGAYPALAGNERLASAEYVLRVLLKGSNAMPPLGRLMSDDQAADVINYIRTHFGNDYRDAVAVAHVRMMGERRAPRVQHGGDPDPGAEALGIGGDGERCLGRCLHQQVVDHALVVVGDVT